MTETKRCTKCGEVKLLEEYYVNRRNPTGRTSWCRACLLEKSRSSQARSRNKGGTRLDHYSEVRGARWRSVCRILEVHHEALKDDPERLSTAFLRSIMGEDAATREGSE